MKNRTDFTYYVPMYQITTKGFKILAAAGPVISWVYDGQEN